jgi:hydrogenase expression/formation protein HypD
MYSVESLLSLIKKTPLTKPLRILNVCGGHERAITRAGFRTLFQHNIHLIPGPGCPVCICPEEDIAFAIHLALNENVVIVSFGDMLRVPINCGIDGCDSLIAAKNRGADVRPISSVQEAVSIAIGEPKKAVVFFAVGFETTMAPVAAALLADLPNNLKVLLSGRLTWPAVSHVLKDQQGTFDALIAPGHVATIMGCEEWQFVIDHHDLPVSISGFHPESLLLSIHALINNYSSKVITLSNSYPEVVNKNGNAAAKALLNKAFTIVDAKWRGIGAIPRSGFSLSTRLSHLDATHHYAPVDYPLQTTRNVFETKPPCEKVILGQMAPDACPFFGKECLPASPKGACMVSDEGACRIWYSSGERSVKKVFDAGTLLRVEAKS